MQAAFGAYDADGGGNQAAAGLVSAFFVFMASTVNIKSLRCAVAAYVDSLCKLLTRICRCRSGKCGLSFFDVVDYLLEPKHVEMDIPDIGQPPLKYQVRTALDARVRFTWLRPQHLASMRMTPFVARRSMR